MTLTPKTSLGRKSLRKSPSKSERRKSATCSRQRCKRRPAVAGWCASHAVAEADRRFSLQVRARGVCELAHYIPQFECSGIHHCAHLLSRRYRATRWMELNAVCACASHHRWFDTNPAHREVIIERMLGGSYRSLRSEAIVGNWRPVLEEFLEEAP